MRRGTIFAISSLLLCAAAARLTSSGTLLALSEHEVAAGAQRTLTFEERVSYQRAIEEVYWRDRIWPKENLHPKPSLDAVMSQAQLENKVAGYLRDSLVLEDQWQRPITAEQLQAEMDRMARDTKQPEVLRELFEALGNDPAVIAECLARPVLVERLVADFSTQDQSRQVESSQNDPLRTSVPTTLGQVVFTLPEIADMCTYDTWTATTTSNAPSARDSHTAVWTGTEMIVWGGLDNVVGYSNTGGTYNPSTDSWIATSTANAPEGRTDHTAVWTGTEMIVWGGGDAVNVSRFNTGGRYNPSTNTWTATSTTNAPTARSDHTAIWTGAEMIVWGGFEQVATSNTGGRYNPGTNTWIATSTTNAASARGGHTAVWTGSEMIIWGGYTGNTVPLITGGRYNPGTNTWIATSTTNAPPARYFHTAVWTGSEMIVWGGYAVDQHGVVQATNTGGKYNPGTNSWRATTTIRAPTPRGDHTAVWTGSEMIVWGAAFSTGARYQPAAGGWRATSTTNAPIGWLDHTAIWTGSEMIVWGGAGSRGLKTNTGGRYCAQSPPPPRPTPPPRLTPP